MIARLPLLALGLLTAGIALLPASAQPLTGEITRDSTPPMPAPNLTRTTVYGNDPCPRGNGDEIVVCAREPESERYRIPKKIRQAEKNGDAEAWGSRAASLEYAGASGTASCSPAGAGGWTGCQSRLLARARAERRQKKAEAAYVP